MEFYHRVSGNGQGYSLVFMDSCGKFNPIDLECVNWHTFKEGDKLYLFLEEPVGTAVKVTGNKIVFA